MLATNYPFIQALEALADGSLIKVHWPPRRARPSGFVLMRKRGSVVDVVLDPLDACSGPSRSLRDNDWAHRLWITLVEESEIDRIAALAAFGNDLLLEEAKEAYDRHCNDKA